MNNINTIGHYISSLYQSINTLQGLVSKQASDIVLLEERVKKIENYNEELVRSISQVPPPVVDPEVALDQGKSNFTLNSTVTNDDIEIVPKKKKPVKKQVVDACTA